MAIERAHMRQLPKPWGVVDPRPWSNAADDGTAIGEICFERPSNPDAPPALLLKLLLTHAPLSIQVHPDDATARSMGLPNGKTEAWHVLSAEPGAAVALGLKQTMTVPQLRSAVGDGSIEGLVAWRDVAAGDTICVPAGTIHAIGAGLVIAEIQQRSDTTFRLFDQGGRELHIEPALAAARPEPAVDAASPTRLPNGRTLLAINAHFVLERIELAPNSSWCVEAARETWLLVVDGTARADVFDLARGNALFAQSACVRLCAGKCGVVCLIAYTGDGGVLPQLLQRSGEPAADGFPEALAISARPRTTGNGVSTSSSLGTAP